MKEYVTLKDVAQKAGLSISSVSKILSGKDNFKAATRDRVIKIAEELGYSPNALARGVKNRSGYRTIGFFVPNILNPFFAELVNEVEKRLSRHGFILTLCIFDDDAKKMSDFLKMLIETRAEGCIIAGTREDACEAEFQQAKRFLNMVSIQADIAGIDRVDVTDEKGTEEIVNYLIGKGHRNIAFLGYRFDISVLKHRLNGYYRALKRASIPIREAYVVESEHDNQALYLSAKKLIELPNRPTAIHCINEFSASSAYLAIRDAGLRIPEDISITGFDGISISKMLLPRLTTIQDPIDLLAQIAVDMLVARIDNQDQSSDNKHIYVQHRMIENDSVAQLE
ncbi:MULTISPECIES: LacI family DNA-binding transcriptional regulator [unclassified Enterococcus]|uniref:LacI family DNA-binding transcriptional regulator n=1 Tax=unclassified Enterococcus TaxID=2608891 RepID=UPI001552C92D|nr:MULTISPECIES: LacI family DNA-binding transcriptional regulator [unclassified Enterococcus]MBS7577900.1 LacI family DNA-binding transcriptional regulator [Enterococcus sp. MMGLQ5-2]MBS7585239.1 LacI family DNA-binding transcriptional regulator [Enterococcus sp. MMGLQ5-1]NPD13096.1 LacI family DNA-binding transcriptional regulator [Enterococcus sp. MMGLQ5-1]NPD37730.1 LacI family DNA-binding transcriptional regulator [Enterococcus sp. MMGLQ5-2]